MKLIKIDETLIEIPDHNYTELVSLHKKAFGSYDSYIDLRKLANIRQEYFDYIDKLTKVIPVLAAIYFIIRSIL